MTIDEFVNYAYSDIEEDAYEGIFEKKKKGIGQALIDKIKSMCKWIKEFITVKIPNFFKNLFKKKPDLRFSDAVKTIKANAKELGIEEQQLAGIAVAGGTVAAAGAAKLATEAKTRMQDAGRLVNDTKAEMQTLISEMKSTNLVSSADANKKHQNRVDAEMNKLTKEQSKEKQKLANKQGKASDERDLYNKQFDSKYATGYKEVEYTDENGNKKKRREYKAGNRVLDFKNRINKWGREKLNIGSKDYLRDVDKKREVNERVNDLKNEGKDLDKDYDLRRRTRRDEMNEEFHNKRNEQTNRASDLISKGDNKLSQLKAAINNKETELTKIEAKYNKKYPGEPITAERAMKGDAAYMRLKKEINDLKALETEYNDRKSSLEKKMK